MKYMREAWKETIQGEVYQSRETIAGWWQGRTTGKHSEAREQRAKNRKVKAKRKRK